MEFSTPLELKFADSGAGQIEGLGAVTGNTDSLGDMIVRGAFAKTLAEHKAAGTFPFMYYDHSAYLGGSTLPIGVYTDMEETDRGLYVKGELIGLDYDPEVRRIHEMMKRGQINRFSIAYSVPPGGATYSKKSGEPSRTLTELKLFAVDVVRLPANAEARVTSVKGVMSMPHTDAAAGSLLKAHAICEECLQGRNSPNSDQRAEIFQHLKEAHKHLTGQDIPGMKMQFDELRELKKWLHRPRDEGGRGFSHSQADEIAELVFKSMPRDEDSDAAANAARKEAVGAIRSLLTGFSLKSPGE